MHSRLLVLVFVAACGSSSGRPPAPPAAEPATEPGPTGEPTQAPPRAGKCPGEGTPCDTPDASCGSEMCRDATTFCNIVVCRDGVWTRVEVPPPPPGG